MTDAELLADRFEAHRTHLLTVAARLLGSVTEAEDAVQETWLRLDRVGDEGIDNPGGWLTTVVSRICLDQLRSRGARREVSSVDSVPEPFDAEHGPEAKVVLGESAAEALTIVIDELSPAERVAFVLHDVFDVPFDQIAPVIGSSSAAARQMASRARRRVKAIAPPTTVNRAAQQEVVRAFLSAAHHGDLQSLIAVLHPDAVLSVDGGNVPGFTRIVRGAESITRQAVGYSAMDIVVRSALINGQVGAVAFRDGQLFSVTEFAIRDRQIVELTICANPERLCQLGL